jgi:hypothetical protein
MTDLEDESDSRAATGNGAVGEQSIWRRLGRRRVGLTGLIAQA